MRTCGSLGSQRFSRRYALTRAKSVGTQTSSLARRLAFRTLSLTSPRPVCARSIGLGVHTHRSSHGSRDLVGPLPSRSSVCVSIRGAGNEVPCYWTNSNKRDRYWNLSGQLHIRSPSSLKRGAVSNVLRDRWYKMATGTGKTQAGAVSGVPSDRWYRFSVLPSISRGVELLY